jgi:hypothetical protein
MPQRADLVELSPQASDAALRIASALGRIGRGDEAAQLLERTREAVGRSGSQGARAAVSAIDRSLAAQRPPD